MRVAQGILLGHIGSSSIEVKPATANLKPVHGAQTRWSEGVDSVIGKARKEQISVVEFMVDPGIESIPKLWG